MGRLTAGARDFLNFIEIPMNRKGTEKGLDLLLATHLLKILPVTMAFAV